MQSIIMEFRDTVRGGDLSELNFGEFCKLWEFLEGRAESGTDTHSAFSIQHSAFGTFSIRQELMSGLDLSKATRLQAMASDGGDLLEPTPLSRTGNSSRGGNKHHDGDLVRTSTGGVGPTPKRTAAFGSAARKLEPMEAAPRLDQDRAARIFANLDMLPLFISALDQLGAANTQELMRVSGERELVDAAEAALLQDVARVTHKSDVQEAMQNGATPPPELSRVIQATLGAVNDVHVLCAVFTRWIRKSVSEGAWLPHAIADMGHSHLKQFSGLPAEEEALLMASLVQQVPEPGRSQITMLVGWLQRMAIPDTSLKRTASQPLTRTAAAQNFGRILAPTLLQRPLAEFNKVELDAQLISTMIQNLDVEEVLAGGPPISAGQLARQTLRQSEKSAGADGAKQHKLWSTFARYDKNGDGTLGPDEVRSIVEEHGFDSPDDAYVQGTMAEFDSNHDGLLDFDEFCKLWKFLEGSPDTPTPVEDPPLRQSEKSAGAD
eukprot:COSAG05_NODE_2045_length_3644_cov_3.395487_1_plen_491_part_10